MDQLDLAETTAQFDPSGPPETPAYQDTEPLPEMKAWPGKEAHPEEVLQHRLVVNDQASEKVDGRESLVTPRTNEKNADYFLDKLHNDLCYDTSCQGDSDLGNLSIQNRLTMQSDLQS